MQSVKEHHPEAQRYCVIVDTDQAPSAELTDEFQTLSLDELNLPYGDEFMFQYTILELNTAVKPWALQQLLDRGHSSVFYIDPDIYLYKPLNEVTALLNDGASLVLTPHLLAPMTDKKIPNELGIRVAGTYNLGFCALSKQDSAYQFLTWWQGKLARDCVIDFPSGIFVDQSWVDLAPSLFNNVKILRHPGYNIAYWNIAQRNVVQDGARFLVNQQDLVFFHYSGMNPQAPQALSKYQDRFTLDSVEPAVKTLVLDYCAKVIANGIEHYKTLPYGYANFDNGTSISVEMRKKFRLDANLRATLGPHPFAYIEELEEESSDEAQDSSPPRQISIGARRLTTIYSYFLGRDPDLQALKQHEARCATIFGFFRSAFGVGKSNESRHFRGWWQRLLLWPAWLILQRFNVHDKRDSVRIPPSASNAAIPSDAVSSSQLSLTSDLKSINKYDAMAAPQGKLGINLVGYIAAELGIGEATRSLARACHASDVAYSVVDVGYQTSNLQRDTQALANASDQRFAIDLLYVNADQTPITLAHLNKLGLASRYKIGFWHWEQPQIPETHYASFAQLDEIWVPSRFVRDAVAAVSPVPVVIIPHALQVKASENLTRSQFGLPEDKVCCLIMYDFHSYQYRKNPQAAIAAFRAAMQGKDDAVLVVKTINSQQHPETAAELRACLADLPGTVVISDFLTRQQTWDLQACCDILISLHRAEGFGLAPAEMMALGKPVVATGWSANMDFMNEENSMPIKFTLKPLAQTIGAYPAGPEWAEADITHASTCIRRLIDQPDLRQQMGARAKQDIERQLSADAVGKLVRERLSLIESYWYPTKK